MEVIFTPHAQEDREYWKQTGNKRVMKRITDLVYSISSGMIYVYVISLRYHYSK